MNIAILIPCYNEEKTIAKVIEDFRTQLPQATIYVFDNNSSDRSAEIARKNGVQVISVRKQGKGFVVRKMFEQIDSDIYVIVDADDTYFAKDVHKLIEPILKDEADMVIGSRRFVSDSAMKKINKIGNILFSRLLKLVFAQPLGDVLSGYRAVSKEWVLNVPLVSYEFQVEMEMTFQSLYRNMRIIEVEVDYKERPQGSFSKLHPFRDGALILGTFMALIRDLMPLYTFSFFAFVLVAFTLGYGLHIYYLPREATLFDNVIIISGLIISFLLLLIGIVLHTINRRFFELIVLIQRNNKHKK
ncbi:MAG: glycosyltransferase family 2 protein [Candidatus Omnitrophica bacterium]|nr:glycosyltransferase family 2 protein [Candidatus Omnitrophota bacterium]